MRRQVWALLSGVLLAAGAVRAEPPLRSAVASSWGPPLLQMNDNQVVGGLVPELVQALAEILRRPVRWVVVPRARMDQVLQEGEADLRCHANPAWMSASALQVAWSPPLYWQRNLLLGLTSVPAVQRWQELPAGSVVGTTAGYIYPPLVEAFAQRRLLREDAIDTQRLFLKLGLARHAYAVMDEITWRWHLGQPGEAHAQRGAWQALLYQQPIFCAMAMGAAAELLPAFETLRRSGKLDDIARRWQLKRVDSP